MDLHDDVGRVGSGARSLATEVAIEQDYRDYLIGRLLPVRGRTGTPTAPSPRSSSTGRQPFGTSRGSSRPRKVACTSWRPPAGKAGRTGRREWKTGPRWAVGSLAASVADLRCKDVL
jgi:hypothetical protein